MEQPTESTGELVKALPKGFVRTEIGMRDVRAKQHYDGQMKLYTACGCGSGKKFKFCCNGKAMFTLNTDA